MISDKRIRELIETAKDAARISDFTPCGMGLAPRIGFSNEVYKATLATLVELEEARTAEASDARLR